MPFVNGCGSEVDPHRHRRADRDTAWESLGTCLGQADGETHFVLPVVVALELVVGSKSKLHLTQAERFLLQFEVLPLDAHSSALAVELARTYGLASGLSLGDVLIAAQALAHQATLMTRNLRHFGVVKGLDVHAPF